MNESSFFGSGWAFPPAFELGDFKMVLSHGQNNIQQSIDIILQTPLLSRSLQPDFGSNLHNFLFRVVDAGVQEEIVDAVKNALLNHEPRIAVESVKVQRVAPTDATLLINIFYIVKESNSRHNHVYPFSILEGTHLAVQSRT